MGVWPECSLLEYHHPHLRCVSPGGIGIIGRFIIDGVNRIRLHQPLPQHFWWLVGGEMALAVLTGILSRAVDYFDNLLADRYTHHVSVG